MWRCLLLVGILTLPSLVAYAGAIHDAAKRGDAAAVAAALDAGVDVNESDGRATALYYAVTKQHLETTRLLLARGAEVNAASSWGAPIINAAWNGDVEILRLLIQHGANPNSEFKTETALHLAAQRGHLECAKLLVEAGADVNALTKFREPPIHFAKKKGHETLVRYFLSNGYVTPSPPAVSVMLVSADVGRGEQLFVRECSRCHDAGPEMRKFRGPPLWNIVGRAAAAIADFQYSPAMKARSGYWTYEDLNSFISDPSGVLPGMDMGSNGLQKATDRADLIAFLRTRSDMPRPLPTE